MAPPPARDFGVVFDIDGVLCRGEDMIPGAAAAVAKVGGGSWWWDKAGERGFALDPADPRPAPPLQVAAARVPHVFVTNQGWLSEHDRASLLAEQLGAPVSPGQCVLAHSALADALPSIGGGSDGLVLVTGRCRTPATRIVRGYGYRNVRSVAAYSRALPHLNPLKHAGVGAGQVAGSGPNARPGEDGGGAGDGACDSDDDGADPSWAASPVRAVILLETPADWHDDLQVIVDVLRSDGRPGRPAPAGAQPVAFVCCNFDALFAASHPVPRFGPGAFLVALKALFAMVTGGQALAVVEHGKPHAPAYRAAVRKLASRSTALAAPSPPPPLRHIYAIGDNPASDVRGANAAGGAWRSVLVRSGVWRSPDANDGGDPAHFVCDDVVAAVAMIFRDNGVGSE